MLAFDLSPETLVRSRWGRCRSRDPVNLERPVTLMTRMGGHLVQGHVDGVGLVVEVDRRRGGPRAVRGPAGDLARYVVEKGSIAVDGVSLTVTEVDDERFGVALIPVHTMAATTLGKRAPGDAVNLEVDLMAKYVERLLRRDR